MTNGNLSARKRAASLIDEALETGVRGELREVLKKAAALAAGDRVSELSDLEYRKLAVGAKLGDKDRSGLLMRHGRRTGKVWIYRYEHPHTKKQVEFQFGRYPDMGTAEAREVWRDLRAQRLDGKVPTLGGTDERSVLTMGDLIKRYMSEYARKVKRSAHEDERLLTRFILPHYADLPATSFDHEAATAVLSNIVDGGALREAEKVRTVLSTMFNVASGRTRKISMLGGSWLPPDHTNPISSVMLPKQEPRRYNPPLRELRKYVRALDGLGQSGVILRVQLETFARVGEVAAMAWDEIDLDAATWTLPAVRSKNGKEHVVMLSSQTVTRLSEREQVSPFVFPAATDPSRPTDTKLVIRTLSKKRDALGIHPDFSSHASRRAGLTWAAENGASRDIRDRLSNHTGPQEGVDHLYVSAEHNEAARRFTQMWCDHLTGLEAENVAPISGGAV